MTIVSRIFKLLEEGKTKELLELKDKFEMEERERIFNAIIYALDEDGHTGDWKVRFAKDYLKKLNEGYDFSNKNVKRELGGKTL